MIHAMNYQRHKRKLVEKLNKLDNVTNVSDADASVIINLNRRMCPKRPFEVVSKACWMRFGPRPLFVQNGSCCKSPDEVDFSKQFWIIIYTGKEAGHGTPVYAVSNCC